MARRRADTRCVLFMTRDELQHLIDVIVAEVAATTLRPATRCSCHAVLDDCCPDRLRGVLEAGATRVGVHATGGAPSSIAWKARSSSPLPLRR